jgi:hypothetical protein
MMKRAFVRMAWIAAGVILALVLLEVVLRFLPVSKGLHRSNQFARWPLQYTESRFRYDYSIGWAMLNAHHGVTNNYGHVSPFDYRPHSRPLIVMGDSYIESVMNEYSDTLQGQLGRRLGAPESVYGLGVSGASASGYIALARLARAEFAPTAAVILISDGDLSESLLPARGTHYLKRSGGELELWYDPIVSVPLSTRIRNTIGDISLHRYFQINLQFAPENILQAFHDGAPEPKVIEADRVADQRKVADWFLAELPASLGLPVQCIVLLLDSDRYAIYEPKQASTAKDAPEARSYFAEEARKRGFQLQDLGPVFRRRYAQDREKFDYWPIDRHWNRRGHGIAAEESYRLLLSGPSAQHGACLAGPTASLKP